MKKSIALLMPALNEEGSVATTLASIFDSSRLPDEIIIADGGSTDNTVREVMRFADRGVRLQVVDNPKVFAGAGRNEAFAVSSSDIILLVDFGNTIAADWIELMAEPFESGEPTDFVTGAYTPLVESDFEHLVAAIIYHNSSLLDMISLEELMQRLPQTHEPGALSLAISRDMWIRSGGMPDWLRAAEDKLFGRKMMTFDPSYHLLPAARIRHHMRSTPWELMQQMYVYARGDARTKYLRRDIARLFVIYGLLAVSLFIVPITWWTSSLYVAAGAAYAWRGGVHKVRRIDHGIKKWSYVPLSAVVVLARDVGTIGGYLHGLVEWVFAPHYRKSFRQYVSGTSLENHSLSIS